jgi:mono/diheme cytochrome c family protein
MKKLCGFAVIAFAASTLALSGCGLDQYPDYSSNVKFGVRTDPIVLGPVADLGDERYEPDRPGVFPIMKWEQVLEPEFPYNAKFRTKQLAPIIDAMITAEGKDPTKITAHERKILEDKFLRDPKNIDKFYAALDRTVRDPMKMSAKDRKELETALEDQFGTPAKPTINAKAAGISEETIKNLQLDDESLQEGARRYRVHCLHCHGVPGDGRGPTSRWINPHPRDFRRATFKFQSVDQTDGTIRVASRGDLLRTLRQGLEGTAMPTFALLADKELEHLVSYVIYLSIRGNTEYKIVSGFFAVEAKGGGLEWNPIQLGDEEQPDKKQAVQFFAEKVTGGFLEANNPSKAIKPVPYPYKDGDVDALAKSVQRGQQLFTGDPKHPRGKDANCKQCHEDYGRQARFKYDDWGTLARPNNFPQGVFRGGRRPVDMYYRVHSGINGSGMNNFGKVLQGDDIWDLVNFVSSLAYPAMYDRLGIKIN